MDGTLFLTIGERGDRPSAQDRMRHNGSIIRINRDGSIPDDNPFRGQSGEPEIWSYGHRNPQGAALDLDGDLWAVEHGARGGDEVNRIKKGANYGWPVISYGRHYSGLKIGEGTAKSGMEQPAHYWDPSIAPSGMMIYSGALWPEWRGDMFVGSLKFDYISRLDGRPPARGRADRNRGYSSRARYPRGPRRVDLVSQRRAGVGVPDDAGLSRRAAPYGRLLVKNTQYRLPTAKAPMTGDHALSP